VHHRAFIYRFRSGTASYVKTRAPNRPNGAPYVGVTTGGVDIYYTSDASNASSANSYQVAHVDGVNAGQVSAADFALRS
jgi:hypothetical protein